MLDPKKTVSEIAREHPTAVAVFERVGIDYCCGGGARLADACAKAKISLDALESAFAEAPRPGDPAVESFPSATALVEHLLATHHVYTRAALDRLPLLAEKVARVHGEHSPELPEVLRLTSALADDLLPHMDKEERILFPYIVALEEAAASGAPLPFAPFGTVARPIAMMRSEHDDTGNLLRSLREVTKGYALPEHACNSFRALYTDLAALERDIHLHIHLENDVLFPMAWRLESSGRD